MRTVHNPVSWVGFGPDAEAGPPPVEGPYVLAVAAHYPHKNLETLIRAFAQIRSAGVHLDMRLVLAGQLGENLSGIAFYRPLGQVIDDLGLGDAVHVTAYSTIGGSETPIAMPRCSPSPRCSKGSHSHRWRPWASACRS